MKNLSPSFEPALFEKSTYDFWLENQCFDSRDENVPGQKSFSIMIPPPNVTGVLHMGHALSYSIQDILIRWRRMHGDNTLWLPGTDHAGIATQAQVEKQIAKEGKGPTGKPLNRHDLGREKFLERTWKWKEDHHAGISGQLKRMGFSVDWKRERFTMDEGLSSAVREVFVRLYEQGLIYRGERLVNWDTKAQTVLSDLEVIPVERKGHLWHIRYFLCNEDGSDVKDPATGERASIVIATTRPETLLGDTAVAVHPEDERWTFAHGKFAVLPIIGRKVPVICDEYVDREFGSGGLKVTPAHDFNDYELGKKHNLPFIHVMGKDGKITAAGGPFAGLGFADAREKVILELKESGQLVKTEDHVNRVGLSERTEVVVEPMLSKQWFVKIEPLAKPAIQAVETGKIQFYPKTWEKTYFEWMYNIRDWCISRQLWWGHRIPAWYLDGYEEILVSREEPKDGSFWGRPDLKPRQDDDVLDTWFSSGLWPFSTLGWPEKTKPLETFYPNSIMETGFDIIFFWVARMIMFGMHFMDGKIPFERVYLHAMVRDEKGEKMSKSKGNVIDPMQIVDQHGADPLRFTLAAMAGQGRDIKLSVDRVEGYRAFCNKIWNATKFLHLQFEEAQGGPIAEPSQGCAQWLRDHRGDLLPANAWIVSRLQSLIQKVDDGFEKFEINESAQGIYEFAWGEFCDWFIEFSKLPLRSQGPKRIETIITLHYVLEELFKVTHPIMPYVTEELWQSLPFKKAANTPARAFDKKPPVMTVSFQKFPKADPSLVSEAAEARISELKQVILAIRNFRGENNISPKVEFAVSVFGRDASGLARFQKMQSEFKALTRVGEISITQATAAGEFDTVIPVSALGIDLRISLKGLVNVDEESKRVHKEIERITADADFVRNKLSKESFIAKAPAELVAKEKAKLAEFESKITELHAGLKRLERLK